MNGAGKVSRARAGTSTIEVLVSILLLALLGHLSWSLLAASRRAAGRLIVQSEALETERLGWHVVASELNAGVPARDWWVEGSGRILPLRAFRGLAEACPSIPAGPDGALVRYEGIRLAEPEKDSLLALTAGGVWQPLRLTQRAPSSILCPEWPGVGLERWSWEPGVPGAVLLRVFERGSYHLEDRALRYRLGSAGRQPLTAERVESGSAFTAGAGGLDLILRVQVEPGVVWHSRRRLVGSVW